MLIRMGRMTVVMPFQRSSCWMAKAVSLWRMRLMSPGRRKTVWPAKTVDRGNSRATRSHRAEAVSTTSMPVSKRDSAGKPRRRARSTYFSRASLVAAVRRPTDSDSLNAPDVHFGDGDEDEVLVEAGEARG